MALSIPELISLTDGELETRFRQSPELLRETLGDLLQAWEEDRKQNALAHYVPVNPLIYQAHASRAREVVLCGGNRSSKTESMLAELAIQATGLVPKSLVPTYPQEKLHPPIRARIVCNSLTDTLEPVLKPKLRWDQWSGMDRERGHWGWIPRHALPGGTWESAYSEKARTLKVKADGGGLSTIQFTSYDQELSIFAGSSMHFVGHDELPPEAIYRENRMRTLDVQGQIWTAFTPPDETGLRHSDTSWFYDHVYEPGQPGSSKSPDIDTFTLFTEHNRLLLPEDIRALLSTFTEQQQEARLYGRFLHLSGVVYPLFTEREAKWCFGCGRKLVQIHMSCPTCSSTDLAPFSHVVPRHEIPLQWPVLFVIDPHPRKADACGWFAITPSDDVVMIGELEAEGTAEDVIREITRWETQHKVTPVRRIMDPNIATETNDRTERGWTIRMAYDRAGLRCDLANDSLSMGIQNVNEWLRPDRQTRRPRFRTFSDNVKFIYGMTHWSWDEWKSADKEPKERVRDRWKDFPDLARYAANDQPTYAGLTRSVWSHPVATFQGRHYASR